MEKKIITEISRIKQIMNKNFLFESVIPKPKFITQLINALTPTIGSTKPSYYDDFISALRVAGNNKTNQWNVILNFAKTNDVFFKKILNILSAGLTPNNVENIKKLKKIISDNIIEDPNIDKEVLKQNINNVWESELGTNPAVEIIKIDFNKFIDEFTPPTKPDVPVPIVPLKNPYRNFNSVRKFLLESFGQKFIKKELIEINDLVKIIKDDSSELLQKQIALRKIATHYMALKNSNQTLKNMLESLIQKENISMDVINKDNILKTILVGEYNGIDVKSWRKINDGIFKPLKEAFIGVKGSHWSTMKSRWVNYMKFSTFKNDTEILALAASRTVPQRIRALIIGIIIQNYLIIPSFIAIIKSYTDKVKNLFNKDTIALRTQFIKDCNEKLDNETCEEEANKIFGDGNDVESEKKLLNAFIKNWKESIPTELSNNPYTLNLDDEDLNIAMTVVNKSLFWTSIDDLAIGTIKRASALYDWMGSETEKTRTNVTARLKCLNILKGVKDMKDFNKIKAYSDFEKCVNSTSPTPPPPPPPPETNTITTTPVVYTNNEPSFIEYLKTINKEYKEGTYSEDGEGGQDKNGKWYFLNNQKFEPSE